MFRSGALVQLREPRGEVTLGERGRVIGRYANDMTVLVAFTGATIRVRPAELEAAAGRRVAA